MAIVLEPANSSLSALIGRLSARLWIALIDATSNWSQRARTRLAAVIGDLLWWVVVPRRRITLTNLRLCFPALSEQQRLHIARRCFRNIARSGLDRSVLSKGERSTVEQYVKVQGIEHLQAAAGRPLILIAPHFVGLDAGGIRFNTLMRGISIYSTQTNAVWDAWLLMARQRFNDPVLVARQGADMRTVIRSVKSGLPLYYLPDMDLGAANSIFVPFFGVPAATIPMVPRIARIIGAQVMMAVTEMTDDGYVLHFEPPWADFPGESIEADTARMNREIERWVLKMPDQYMWTHRRFKTRPAGLRKRLWSRFSRGRESMKLRFTKMHGAGNDFVMLNGVTQRIDLSREQLRLLADRRFGVGADQILLVEPAPEPDLDFRYRIFNSDGGEVEQCGNGARCFVKFVHDEGLTSKRAIRVQTLARHHRAAAAGKWRSVGRHGSAAFRSGRRRLRRERLDADRRTRSSAVAARRRTCESIGRGAIDGQSARSADGA